MVAQIRSTVSVGTTAAGNAINAKWFLDRGASALVEDEKIRMNMEDVLFIPELSLNLLSLQCLENTGKRVTFLGGCVTVEDGDEIVVTGRHLERLYCMNLVCENNV